MREHPTPWQVKYRTMDGWHEKASPYVADANGSAVAYMPQFVNHPGLHDEEADHLAHWIANAVNNSDSEPYRDWGGHCSDEEPEPHFGDSSDLN